MAWSTRELADLAGTTVNTVRHYHQVGLLEDPARQANGYKSYEVRHLVQLLRIRRLRDLGVPIDLIDDVAVGDDRSLTMLTDLEVDLASTVERLQQARTELRLIIDGSAMPDVPPGFAHVSSRLSVTDRALMLIYAQLYDEQAMRDIREMLESDPEEIRLAFDTLAADADEETRSGLAERYAVGLARDLQKYPWLLDPTARQAKSARITGHALTEAIGELYNPAQLDVLLRATPLAMELMSRTEPL